MKKYSGRQALEELLGKRKKMIEFLSGISEKTPCGRYDFDNNEYINVVEYNTDEKNGDVFEAHRIYTDIHYLLSGEESIEFCDKKDSEFYKEYDSLNDSELVNCRRYERMRYSAGEFIEILPNEPHMAGYYEEEKSAVKKAILKIKE